MLNHIQETTDPLVAAMSAILIVGTALLALLLDRLYGLDRMLGCMNSVRAHILAHQGMRCCQGGDSAMMLL
jgi:hypothetical protein